MEEKMKAILVIDTPSCCGGCPCCQKQEDNWGDIAWAECYNGKSVYDYCDVGRPDWCPLKLLPQEREFAKQNILPIKVDGNSFALGRNACLKEITGETE